MFLSIFPKFQSLWLWNKKDLCYFLSQDFHSLVCSACLGFLWRNRLKANLESSCSWTIAQHVQKSTCVLLVDMPPVALAWELWFESYCHAKSHSGFPPRLGTMSRVPGDGQCQSGRGVEFWVKGKTRKISNFCLPHHFWPTMHNYIII